MHSDYDTIFWPISFNLDHILIYDNLRRIMWAQAYIQGARLS